MYITSPDQKFKRRVTITILKTKRQGAEQKSLNHGNGGVVRGKREIGRNPGKGKLEEDEDKGLGWSSKVLRQWGRRSVAMDFNWEEDSHSSYRSRNPTEENRVVELVKSSLVCLTQENFEAVKDQLVRTISGNPSALVLKSLVSLIFDLAVADDSLNLCGRLCVTLCCELPPVPSEESFGRHITFKKLLLNKCQIEFVTSVTERVPSVYNEKAVRLRLVSIVGLVAELFKCGLVTEKICQSIMGVLTDPAGQVERNIEAIYRFLTLLGEEFDTSPTFQRSYDLHSGRLDDFLRNHSISSRSRDMLILLKYLRANSLVKCKAGARSPAEVTPSNLCLGCKPEPSSSRVHVAQSVGGVSETEFKNVLRDFKETEVLLGIEREKLGNVKQLLESHVEERTNMQLQAQVLERKYHDEMRVRKEAEEALVKEKEKVEMLEELFQSYKKERDDMGVESGLLEEKYNVELRLRKETEEMLARERAELDKLKEQLDAIKDEQRKMDMQAGVWQVKYNNESRLRKEMEDAVARGKEEMEIMKQKLETYKEERDKMEAERDNAISAASALVGSKAEGSEAPASFVCPITQDVMRDPQVAADGFTYEGEAIGRWLRGSYISPMTNLRLSHRALVPNIALRTLIEEWLMR